MAQAQDDSAYQENPYGTQDPAALFQHLSEQNQGRAPSDMIRQGALVAGFNPTMQHANTVQARMKEIMSQVGEQRPNEDPYDYQMRQASAVSSGMANVDPMTAVRADQQKLRLVNAKAEQAKLGATTALTQQQVEEAKVKIAAEKAEPMVMVTPATDAYGFQTYKQVGNPVSRYDESGKELTGWSSQLATEGQGNPKAIPMTTSQFVAAVKGANENNSLARMMAMQQRAALTGAMPYEQMDENTKSEAAVSTLLNLPMRNQSYAAAGLRYLGDMGIRPEDRAGFQLEYKGAVQAVQSGERRRANVAILNQEVPAAGNEVLNALDGVDRTRLPLINLALRQGALQFNGSPAEVRLFNSILSFTGIYGRLLSGGGAQTFEGARHEAHEAINILQSKQGVKAGIDQLANREAQVVHDASDTAVEALANPEKYKVMNKVLTRLGSQFRTGDQMAYGNPQGAGEATSSVATPATTQLPKAGTGKETINTPPGQRTPTITSQAQYDALPDGADYLDADGKPARKGGHK